MISPNFNQDIKFSKRIMPEMRRIHHLFFIGIGGVGMSGIAEVLINLGYKISGSDQVESAQIQHLKTLGATVYIGHEHSHIKEVDAVVISSAISENNPEFIAAKALQLPIVERAQMLAELMRFSHGIAVSGTHGKTTTTSLISSVLAEGGLDPTFVIGGKLNQAGANAKLGTGKFFVAEADESDASFLFMQPLTAVITNIDTDHMDTYSNDFDNLKNSFLKFLHHLPFYGLAVLCLDDPIIQEILPEIMRPKLTYGMHKDADIRAIDIKQIGLQTIFNVQRKNQPLLPITLNLPGKHNVLNALAALTIATDIGLSDQIIQKSLAEFQGIGRRFQVYNEFKLKSANISIVDDYGHHPVEIAATIATTREIWPKRKLIMIFQPHRFSRTKSLYEDFVQVLSEVDHLFLLDVYAAGEQPINNVDAKNLCQSIKAVSKSSPIHVQDWQDIENMIPQFLTTDTTVLTQGAGNVGQIAQTLTKNLPNLR